MKRARLTFEIGKSYILNDGRVARLLEIRDTGHRAINARTLKPMGRIDLLILKISHGNRLVLWGDGTYMGKPSDPLSIVCELSPGRRRAA